MDSTIVSLIRQIESGSTEGIVTLVTVTVILVFRLFFRRKVK